MKEYKSFLSEASSSPGEKSSRAIKTRRTKNKNQIAKLTLDGIKPRIDTEVADVRGQETELQGRYAAAINKRNKQIAARKIKEKKDAEIKTAVAKHRKDILNRKEEGEAAKTKYGRTETEKEAERAAEREKIQAPEVRRKAAAEPLSGGDVKKQARLNLRKQLKGKSAEERKQGFKNARTPMATAKRATGAVVGARVKKEKERIKTDPVGQVKKYASGVGNAARATARALTPKSGSIGTTGGGDSSERGVRYQ